MMSIATEREEKTLWKGKYLALKDITERLLKECECKVNNQDSFKKMKNKFCELTKDD